jgi:hypothetical protein
MSWHFLIPNSSFFILHLLRRVRATARFAALLSVIGTVGCTSDGHFKFLGYTSEPNYDSGIQTVYVPIAQNISFRRGIEFELTQAVIREIGWKTPLRVVSNCAEADTQLDMKIVNRRKALILPNPLNEVRDSEVTMMVEVVWRDLRPGHKGDILSNPQRYDPNELPLPGQGAAPVPKAIPVLVTPNVTYQPELGGSTATAEQQALSRAATQIVNMMEKGW